MEHNHEGHAHHHAHKATLSTPVAVIIAGIIIAAAIVFTNGRGGDDNKQPAAAQGAPKAQVAVDIAKVKTAGEPFIGNANAPVTIAFWSDYQCPFCKRFSNDSIAGLKKDYVNSGKVKIVFKDFVFLGDDSKTAALFARAVWEAAPEKFGEWHDAMMDKQDGENSGWGNAEDVQALTNQILGNDKGAQVATLVKTKSDTYQAALDANRAEATGFGISGTPATIIGKTFISGAQPYSVVKAAVEKLLK